MDAPYAPARSLAESSEKIVDSKQTPQDAPRASAPGAENSERVAIGAENFKDAPRASAPTRSYPLKTARWSSIPNRIPRTLHVPTLPPTENNVRVVICAESFEDAPRASLTTKPEHRRYTQRVVVLAENFVDAPRAGAWFARAENFENAPRASVTTGRDDSRLKFRRRSTRQRHDGPRAPRGASFALRISRTLHAPARRQAGPPRESSFVPRISKTLHAPASRQAGTTKRFVVRAESLEDAPHASAILKSRSDSR